MQPQPGENVVQQQNNGLNDQPVFDPFDLGHIQMGFVQTYMHPTQQALTQTSFAPQSPSATAIRCWAKYFSNVDRTLPSVTISA